MNFGKRLKGLRERENLSREALAKKIGISYWSLSKYETGNREPDIDTLQKIADFFDVSLDYLTGRSDEMGSTDDSRSQAWRELEKLAKEEGITDLYTSRPGDPTDDMPEEMIRDIIMGIKLAKSYREEQRKREEKK
ncbi:helix-turn-helix domain-containing protein [Kroppenstedtia sanguinis]|uniref:Helix-turn-helix domain-containing protein n=1 Tax=Kroppenstedtia sanguinis TaxID=1380684 RepID=A0ABW4C5L8_9BACL